MKDRIPYAAAKTTADYVVAILAPACHRIEIAGSLRRCKPEIGDIEIVAIPRWEVERDLFGDVVASYSALDGAIPANWRRLKDGPAYKQLMPGYVTVIDLFIVTAETWGVQFVLRTGSADFSHWLVTSQEHGGALPPRCRVHSGRLWHNTKVIPTPEEQDFFAAIGLDYIEPPDRTEGRWR